MDKLFSQHSITEISEKTHISPIILEKLKQKEFSKLTKIKINGFIHILESEYPEYDFSNLKSSIFEYFDTSKEEIADIAVETIEKKDSSSKKNYIILILLILGIIALMIKLSLKDEKLNNTQKNNKISVMSTDKNESNTTPIKAINTLKTEKNITKNKKIATSIIEKNVTKSSKKVNLVKTNDKKEENLTLAIIPLKKVWFKVTYLDNFKSKEYLTSHEIDLNGTRPMFIKFGHGFIKIIYNHHILEPNDKHITRIIEQNKELNITKKIVSEFK